MMQRLHVRRLTSPSLPVRILNNPDGSVCLISGSTKFIVSETPLDVKPDPTNPRCLTRAQSKIKMETVAPLKLSEKPWPARPRPGEKPSSPSKPLVRSVFICFFCKHEFDCRIDLIRHQDKCSAVPDGLRRQDNEPNPETRTFRRHSDLDDQPYGETSSIIAEMKAKSCEKTVVSDVERRRTRSEADDVSVVSDPIRSPGRMSDISGRSPIRTDVEIVKRARLESNCQESLAAEIVKRARLESNCQESLAAARSPERRVCLPKLNPVPLVKVEPVSPIRPGPKCSKPRITEPLKLNDLIELKPDDDVRQRLTVRRNLLGKAPMTKERFTNALFLIPVAEVKDIEQEMREHNEIVEIDLTDETDALAPKSPRTPATPRTLKSLLSFDSSQCQSNKASKDVVEEGEEEGEEEEEEEERSSIDSDSDSNKSRRAHHYHIPTNKTLLSIALSSVLGQKLRHLVDGAVERTHREKDYEKFCRTPMKSTFQDRLRCRDSNTFPVTFRKNKHHRVHHHVYKFTKKQKAEFMQTVTTGLNRRSRRVYKSLPKCTVKLRRLTMRDIKRLSKLKPKPQIRIPFGDSRQWRQPNILRKVAPKLTPGQLMVNPGLAALLRSPSRLEPVTFLNRYGGPPRPVSFFMNYHQQKVQPHIQPNIVLQQRQVGFLWNQSNPNRAVAQVSPIIKVNCGAHKVLPVQQARVAPMSKTAGASSDDKMVEQKIDDDISIVVPATDYLTLSSSNNGETLSQRHKRALANVTMPKVARFHHPNTMKKSYCAPLTELPSPAKRVITAAAADDKGDKTFLFRCHLCGLEERHKISHSKDIYKHLHSNHRGEVIHIVDYKLHGEVHLVEAMSKPPTVMKTAPEVAKCTGQTAAAAAAESLIRPAGKAVSKPSPMDVVICLDD